MDTAVAPLATRWMGIKQQPGGDFTDLWPFLLKLLLTEDPVQILFRDSYLASPFRILITFYVWLFRMPPIQFRASVGAPQHWGFITCGGTEGSFSLYHLHFLWNSGLCSPACPKRTFLGADLLVLTCVKSCKNSPGWAWLCYQEILWSSVQAGCCF